MGVMGDVVCSQTLACPFSCCRFKSLIDINSNHYFLFNSGIRWLSFWLDFLSTMITLLVSLFVVLSSNDFISPALKGLALSYATEVYLDSKLMHIWYVFVKSHCKQLQQVCCVCVLSS